MASDVFTKQVLLDVSVNIVPLCVLGAFLAMFVSITPWGSGGSFGSILQVALVVAPFVGLAVLTYVAARKIET
ncbi:MAG: DUF6684 family protein [Haloferacaceae archaeon]